MGWGVWVALQTLTINEVVEREEANAPELFDYNKLSLKKGNQTGPGPKAPYFLSVDEKEFFEALCETVVPEGSNPAEEPGALTVGALSYIDSTLFDLPRQAQEYFRKAIELLNELSKEEFSSEFQKLSLPNRNAVLRDFYLDQKTREMMFDLRSIALEGFYSDYHDPSYLGKTGWDFTHFGGKRISDLKKDWSFVKIWREKMGEPNA